MLFALGSLFPCSPPAAVGAAAAAGVVAVAASEELLAFCSPGIVSGLTSEGRTIPGNVSGCCTMLSFACCALNTEGKGDNGTRAITTDTEDGKEILNVAWTAGEEVAVYYQKSDDTYATATATVGEPNADGSASITASLDSPKNGGTVKFVYPATLHNGTGDIDESKLLNDQRGFLTYSGWGPDRYSISKFFDAATGSGTLSVSPGKAVTTNRISLTNRCCICKFNLGLVMD